jgi:CRP-like cAMP-binding protein
MLRYRTNDTELEEATLFAGLSRRHLTLVRRLSTPIELPAGHVLAHEGERGAEFFVVVEGAVEVVQRGTLVATRGAGSPLGEIALLAGGRRTATLIAQTPVRARVSSRREFSGLLAEIPEVSRRLRATMAERLAS